MTFQANARIGGILRCPVVGRRVPKVGQALGTDKTAMDFRRRLPEIRWQLKAVAIGGHASIIASRATSHFCP